jgi:hypothetical protein
VTRFLLAVFADGAAAIRRRAGDSEECAGFTEGLAASSTATGPATGVTASVEAKNKSEVCPVIGMTAYYTMLRVSNVTH